MKVIARARPLRARLAALVLPLVLILVAGTASAQSEAGSDVAPEKADRSRLVRFGWIGRLGPEGRGTVTNGLEVLHEVTGELERKVRLYSFRDLLVEIRQDLRVMDKQSQIDEIDDWREYRMSPDKMRTVTVTIQGDQVSHVNQGPLGRRQSPGIPSQMDDPLVLDDDLISSYVLLIETLLGRIEDAEGFERIEKLDGTRVAAISPGRLSVYDYRFEVGEAETLEEHLVRPIETRRVDVIREDKPIAGRPRNPDLDLKRSFWLDENGTLIRTTTPHQMPRHQGTVEGYNLEFAPGFAGLVGEELPLALPNRQATQMVLHTSDVEPIVRPTVAKSARPTVVILHDDTEASRRIAHALRWRWVPGGINTLSVGVAASDQAGALETIRTVIDTRAELSEETRVLVSIGDLSPDLVRALAGFGGRGWTTVNSACLSYPADAAEALELPVLAVWGATGDGAQDRSDWGRWITSKVQKGQVEQIADADQTLRAQDTTAAGRFGLSQRALSEIDAWVKTRLQK